MKNVLVTDENPSTDKRGLCEKTKQSTVSGGQIGPIKDVGGPGEGFGKSELWGSGERWVQRGGGQVTGVSMCSIPRIRQP